MDDDYDDMDMEVRTKRKYQKKGSSVPLSDLGFKAKVFYDSHSIIERKKKPAKYYGKYSICNK